MIISEENYLEHYGILRKSGRYPWGSGDTPVQRSQSFIDSVDILRKQHNMSDTEIAKGFGMTSKELRDTKSIAVNQLRQEKINQAQRLKDKGLSDSAIGRVMFMNESSVRSLLDPGRKTNADILQATANMLKREVDEKEYLDVGRGQEHAQSIGVTRTRFDTAIHYLKDLGYETHTVYIPQVGMPGKYTTTKVLGLPGSPKPRISQIRYITEHSDDGGRSYLGIVDPLSISSKRVAVNWKEDGGGDKDGVIYVRPGVSDLSMGKSRYAQVRVLVDNSHYMKGMAVYKEDLPKGVDLVFNTSSSKSSNKMDAFKPIKDDPDNPFGAQLKRQITVRDEHGKDRATSVMNIVNEEGDWRNWSKSIASQVLSKQSEGLARSQLSMLHAEKRDELDEIKKLTNPVIKKKLLETFADSADASAAHLEAAHLPRQAFHVILPFPGIKRDEVYAPNFREGENVVLIRYPHGGTFEIASLKVNNKYPEAKRIFKPDAADAIGIHPSVAQHLSGADFDGDTVLVIPNNKRLIKVTPALEGLKNFVPRDSYPPYDGMRTIDGGTWNAKEKKVDFPKVRNHDGTIVEALPKKSPKQNEMGKITNLITDMTIHGANHDELSRAIRHSMVVIDCEKHSLDYKSSERVNGIKELKDKYQGGGGASTLISRAGSPQYINRRRLRRPREGGPVDPRTGEKVWVPTGASYVDKKTGKTIYKKESVDLLVLTRNARDIMSTPSGTQMEVIYADHSNRMKALGNEARKEALTIKPRKINKSAKSVYAPEIEELNRKIREAEAYAPFERRAQAIANQTIRLKKQANPNMTSEDERKIRGQALAEARSRVTGGKPGKTRITLTQKEWDAIQAGGVSTNKLIKIINNSDLDELKKLAMPRTAPVMTSVKLQRAQLMLGSGFTQRQVADALGVPLSTLTSSIARIEHD